MFLCLLCLLNSSDRELFVSHVLLCAVLASLFWGYWCTITRRTYAWNRKSDCVWQWRLRKRHYHRLVNLRLCRRSDRAMVVAAAANQKITTINHISMQCDRVKVNSVFETEYLFGRFRQRGRDVVTCRSCYYVGIMVPYCYSQTKLMRKKFI